VPVFPPPGYFYRPYATPFVPGTPVGVPSTPGAYGINPAVQPALTPQPPFANFAPLGLGVPPINPAFNPPFGNPAVNAPAGADVDQALQQLSSPRERDRMEAAIILGRNKIAKAVDPLQRTLANDSSPRVREAAARALGLLGDPASLRALNTAAQVDDDKDVRHSARFAAESIRAGTR
jgi:hypothetical protein